MGTYVVRVWLPDRPGALGAVASRIGAVRGDVVGIDILETGGGQAVDELVVQLPDAQLVDLLVNEIAQVDGVKVEEVRPAAEGGHDPRLDALETAAVLVGASTAEGLLAALCEHGGRTLGARWVAVVELAAGTMVDSTGPVPAEAWLAAFLRAVRSAPRSEPSDLAWTPLPASGLAVVAGREHPALRARERRQLAALARIADTRLRELDPGQILSGSTGRDLPGTV